MALVLGSFIFTDYSIPETVGQGGEHKHVVHKLVGGQRIIDAMGQDDRDIGWSGRFQGSDAIAKVTTIDQLRKSGGQVPLIVDSQFYTVTVFKFEWEYERFYQVLYRIQCLVVSSSGPANSQPQSLDSLISNDMTSAGAQVSSFSVNQNESISFPSGSLQ